MAKLIINIARIIETQGSDWTHRNDPHLLGGTRLSVLGEARLSEERAQEFLLTRLLGLLPGESG